MPEVEGTGYRIHFTEEECIEPNSDLVVVVTGCTSGRWVLRDTGMMVWKEAGAKSEIGRCFTSIWSNEKILMKPCQELDENQYVEIGAYEGSELLPLCRDCWRRRQEILRNKQLVEYKKTVTETLKSISDLEVANLGMKRTRERRAVVFYVDNKHSVSYLRWWIRSWRFIGLDEALESFDIVVMVDSDILAEIPPDCNEYTPDFKTELAGPGKCIYKQYIGRIRYLIFFVSYIPAGIAKRDPSYDVMMNSMDCIIGPGTEFLGKYKLLLRADVDTFPLPYLLGFWPDQVKGSCR